MFVTFLLYHNAGVFSPKAHLLVPTTKLFGKTSLKKGQILMEFFCLQTNMFELLQEETVVLNRKIIGQKL